MIFDDTFASPAQYPWLRLTLTKAGGELATEETAEGKKTQKIDAAVDSLGVELAKRVDDAGAYMIISEGKAQLPEGIQPHIVVLYNANKYAA